MPKTFRQSVLFTILMASAMVYIMSVYNLMLWHHVWDWSVFRLSMQKYIMELAVAFLMALFGAGSVAPKMARIVLPKDAHTFVNGAVVTFFIAGIMVPLMTLFVYVS